MPIVMNNNNNMHVTRKEEEEMYKVDAHCALLL